MLHDPRFAAVFEDPEFEVDESTREFALLNPSAVAQRQNREVGRPRGKTAVEEEEEDGRDVFCFILFIRTFWTFHV